MSTGLIAWKALCPDVLLLQVDDLGALAQHSNALVYPLKGSCTEGLQTLG